MKASGMVDLIPGASSNFDFQLVLKKKQID